MNKALLLLMVLMSSAFASELLTIDVDRSGQSSVVLSLESEESATIALPQDASNFRIVGGSYETSNGTATVSSGQAGFTTFSFSSSALTTKTTDGWKLLFTASNTSTAVVYMPAHAVISSSSPKPLKVSADDSRTSLEFAGGPITLEYVLGELPEPKTSDSSYLLFAAGLLGIAIVAAAYLVRGKQQTTKEKKSSLGMTPGKNEMMQTFNENDKTIVNYLLSCEGKSRRNDLERKTSISKSSLAKAINRLEKRRIIEIDRSATTHFVKLADYFLKL